MPSGPIRHEGGGGGRTLNSNLDLFLLICYVVDGMYALLYFALPIYNERQKKIIMIPFVIVVIMHSLVFLRL